MIFKLAREDFLRNQRQRDWSTSLLTDFYRSPETVLVTASSKSDSICLSKDVEAAVRILPFKRFRLTKFSLKAMI